MSKVLFFISPTINSFADKNKGSKANKTACAVSHFTNSAKSNAQIITAAGLTALIGHYMPLTKMAKPNKINWKNLKEASKTILQDFKSAPKAIKIAAFGAMAISLVNRTFKKFEIEHKYLDRAILEETKREREEKKLLEKMAKTKQEKEIPAETKIDTSK